MELGRRPLPGRVPALAGLLAYPKAEPAAAARRRLAAVLPREPTLAEASPEEVARWAERNAARLSWDDSRGVWKD